MKKGKIISFDEIQNNLNGEILDDELDAELDEDFEDESDEEFDDEFEDEFDDVLFDETVHGRLAAVKLHLELDITGADENVLKKWGRVTKGISRDVLVPPEIPLHALHFVIQQCFGWHNSHLHHFEFPEDVMKKLLKDSFAEFCRYCGLYFRFPYEDTEEELRDIYWDDDYDGKMDPRKWMSSKYKGPYLYMGQHEHYILAQNEVWNFWEQEEVQIPPTFEKYMNGRKKPRKVRLVDAGYDEMSGYFEYKTGELIERSGIMEFLRNSEKWSPDIELAVARAQMLADKAEETLDNDIEQFDRFIREMQEIIESGRKKGKLSEEQEELLGEKFFMSQSLLRKNEPVMPPLAEELVYRYDYGDDWTVRITRMDDYSFEPIASDDDEVGGLMFVDQSGEEVRDPKLLDGLFKVFETDSPVCIAADGLPVMDDVGGVMGYVDFLEVIHGAFSDVDEEEIAERREWAKSMGWTGRLRKPENIL